MPAIGLGVHRAAPEETTAAVHAALAGGYRLIDTTAAYMNEEQVGDRTRLVARIITDAGVYHRRAKWPLPLSPDHARQGDRWLALRAVATLWDELAQAAPEPAGTSGIHAQGR
ncbi:2,5-diketo-D-gluconic acid reductase A [Marinibacterium anthonyi]|nr:2,5-diketo-D-gluconic acid reductase A [Marinibacterium anthonyi]